MSRKARTLPLASIPLPGISPRSLIAKAYTSLRDEFGGIKELRSAIEPFSHRNGRETLYTAQSLGEESPTTCSASLIAQAKAQGSFPTVPRSVKSPTCLHSTA